MGTKEGKHSNSEGDALFREAVGDARPINAPDRHSPEKERPRRAISRRRDEQLALRESRSDSSDYQEPDFSDELSYHRQGMSRRILRDLRRGKLSLQAEIDLHGCRRDEARNALQDFIDECCARNLRCVRVVHGKGYRSGPDGPVLKTAVGGWLRKWDPVLAFCPARNCDGGTGALYVLLRRS